MCVWLCTTIRSAKGVASIYRRFILSSREASAILVWDVWWTRWLLEGEWTLHGRQKKDSPLVNWVIQQRTCFNGVGIRSRTLGKMEVYLLEKIGFPWTSDRYEIEWQHNFEKLAKFIEARCYIPKMSENRKLVNWMEKQRKRYKGQSYREMTENEIQQLEKIGFQWSLRSWQPNWKCFFIQYCAA